MKSFLVCLAALGLFVSGLLVGMKTEHARPIPTEEVRFDPDSMSFVRVDR